MNTYHKNQDIVKLNKQAAFIVVMIDNKTRVKQQYNKSTAKIHTIVFLDAERKVLDTQKPSKTFFQFKTNDLDEEYLKIIIDTKL